MDQAPGVLHSARTRYAGPPRPVVNWMSDVWRTLSALGDSRWLLPMALVLLFTLPRADARLKWLMFGAILATAIAWSRVPLYAHTLSEVIAGLMLGLGCSAPALCALPPSKCPGGRNLLLSVLIGLMLPLSLPDLSTHQLVKALANTLGSPTMTIEER